MRTLRRTALAEAVSRACVTGLLAVSTLHAQAVAPQSSEQNGKRLFAAYYCVACHGTMGQGGAAGARIAPRPIAFPAFQKYLRQPTGQMAPYTRNVLPDGDLADIYAFLRSVPLPPSTKDIPLLQQ